MKVSLPQLETGSKLTIHTNITTGLGGRFQYNIRNQSYTTEMDLPQERQEILSTKYVIYEPFMDRYQEIKKRFMISCTYLDPPPFYFFAQLER